MQKHYHTTVLLQQTVDFLNVKKGVFVDCTLGGGGHTELILSSNPDAFVYAFDKDPDAIAYASKRLEKYNGRFKIINSDFKNLRTKLALEKVKKIDGIIMDLGVSAYQFAAAERGFSFQHNAALDMRMDKTSLLTAKTFLNEADSTEIANVIKEYGEEKHAKKIAKAICAFTKTKELNTTFELAEIIDSVTPGLKAVKTKARVFQAIRIYVNGELEALKLALADAVNILSIGGKIAVISYHSLEDRIVKNVFKHEASDCICPSHILACNCNKVGRLKILTKKPFIPTEEEIKTNPKSRSARLRVAEKREEL